MWKEYKGLIIFTLVCILSTGSFVYWAIQEGEQKDIRNKKCFNSSKEVSNWVEECSKHRYLSDCLYSAHKLFCEGKDEVPQGN